jgi:hypothetical protein
MSSDVLTHSLNIINGLSKAKDNKNEANTKEIFNSFVNDWKTKFIRRIKSETNSRKLVFTYFDAVERSEGLITKTDAVFIEYFNYINKNPLRENDYYKYLSSYKSGKRLDDKYFRHDLELLNELYQKTDENPDYTPFSVSLWQRYVLFMLFKFNGLYNEQLNDTFGVKVKENREYNPVTSITRPLRGMLPPSLKLKEFDISRAYPTFIDLELNINRTEDVYSLIDKRKFNMLLNTHKDIKNASIDSVRRELKPIYGNLVNKVITEDRFNNKGRLFQDLTKYEAKYINEFIKANKIDMFVRLHDAVIVPLKDEVNVLEFGAVKFKVKELRAPEIINPVKTFYSFGDKGEVVTSAYQYKEFFEQENLIRITEQDNDKITVFKDTNNVIKAFNYRTDTAPFLSENVNEFDVCEVENQIAKDNHSAIYGGFLLLNPKPLIYYSDTATTFGIPFKNGFCMYSKGGDEIVTMHYNDVNGFFAPHATQTRFFEFQENPEMSIFQRFLTMVATRKDPESQMLTDSEQKTADLFYRMFGYLCHTYKNVSFSPAIVLSDEGANDESRNGGRGKSLIVKAVEQVQKTLIKGGNEFDGNYRHRFADLERAHKVYVIDDVPASFKYDDLYTNIAGDISCERKGKTAETINFKDAPKFVITTNWAVRYDDEATSTNRRFIEFQLTDFFNINNTPKDVFEHNLFENWDGFEWNKFYNFVFACVANYIENGLTAPTYKKNDDNFRAYFYNDSILQEFERVFSELTEQQNEFKVNDFLILYKHYSNELRFDNLFTHKNLKKLIDVYIKYNNLKIHYNQRNRSWVIDICFFNENDSTY